ncbi:unnamed protein product [Didymodactylos carnosus]|uniref:EF-hand domain-containing protein n=1 Tax=Didymodactylos carnosus TaxID=1234261 RepID=A0A8S2HP34_9BILA|nr:unnamed protein product [Didymodactylos carnosus]CAF3664872.1 unnamed protein product [Didymodactylos carnosus]
MDKSKVEWIQRPSSAQPNLQSHPCYQSSLLDDNRAPGTVDEWKKSRILGGTKYVGLQNINRNADDYDQNLETKAYFQSFKHLRRLTVANATNIQQSDVILLKRAKSYALVGLKGELKSSPEYSTGRRSQLNKSEELLDDSDKKILEIEERLSISALETIKQAFQVESDELDSSGQMTLDEFKSVVKSCLRSRKGVDEQIEVLFHKIDYNAEGVISWDEFCTFLQLNFDEKANSVKREKEISFVLPAKIEKTPHRFPQTAGIDQTLTARERLEKRKDQQTRSQPKWITDCLIIPEFSKVVISTGDRELQFWDQTSCLSGSRDAKSNDLQCTQISSLESVPIKIHYGTVSDELTLIYGDTDGCVNILIFAAARETFRLLTTAEKKKGIATVAFEKFLDNYRCDYIRWQVHKEWIEHICFDSRLNQIISCSNDQYTAVVIGCIRASTSSEIQLRENKGTSSTIGFNATSKSSLRSKSADLKRLRRRSRANVTITESESADEDNQQLHQKKRDSTTSFYTQWTQDSSTKQQQQSKSKLSSKQLLNHVQFRCDSDQTVFKVYKGVKTFDISVEKNVLVTGGMDRVLRIWNPYVPARPIARLRGHTAPIFYIKIAEDDNRVFSLSTDKSVLVSNEYV